jgi:hypothetical protein
MKMYSVPIILGLISCCACQGPSALNENGKNDTDKTIDSNRKKSDSVTPAGKKDPGFSKQLQMGKISFHIYSPNNPLHNSIIIQPSGLKDSTFIQTGVIGNVNDAFIADLNKDGFPEIFYTTITESGQKNLLGYASNKNINLSPVYMPDIKEDKKWGTGYRGQDEYKISGGYLLRSFPIFTSTDNRSSSSGGIRELNYRLVPATNGWLLKITDAKDKTR